MEAYRLFTDIDGNDYELQPHEYNKGENANVGCAFPICGGSVCNRAKTCTPKSDHKNGFQSLLKGRYVWKLVKHWTEKV